MEPAEEVVLLLSAEAVAVENAEETEENLEGGYDNGEDHDFFAVVNVVFEDLLASVGVGDVAVNKKMRWIRLKAVFLLTPVAC